MTSEVTEVKGLAIITIEKMVKAAKPEQLRPHLVDLIVAMLEGLTGMEVRKAT